jgi:hypothetical protein
MNKLRFIAAFLIAALSLSAQVNKTEVEAIIKTVNFQEIKDVYLIRTREHDGAQGWYEKFEEFDPKTIKITYGDKSMMLEGTSYAIMLPYDKIKLIFYKKGSYLTFEMID